MLKQIIRLISEWKKINIRDRRAHYASTNQMCLRDQFWIWKNEPETNPIDFVGKVKLLVGDWIEAGIVRDVLSNLHFLGYHLIGTQVAVGGSNPNWDGYIDVLVEDRTKTPFEKVIIEIKTKSGFGADLLNSFVDNQSSHSEGISLDHIAQLGLYLKDANEKLNVTRGILLYILLSDNSWGTIVIVNCHYADGFIYLDSIESSATFKQRPLNLKYNINKFLARWVELDKYLASGSPPAGEYKYMHELTDEVLRNMSDDKLKKLINKNIVYGDWQVLYSRYKDKQIEVDGLPHERTQKELNRAIAEYKRRHPKSKLSNKKGE